MPGKPEESKLPIINGKEALASVEGEPISVGEFNRVMYQVHENMAAQNKGNEKTPDRIDYAGVLDRIINVHLADQEAKRIGLDRFPVVKNQVSSFSDTVLARMAIPQHFKNVRPDPVFERKVYRSLVKEYRLKSAVFNVKSLALQTRDQMQLRKALEKQKKAIDLLNTWARNEKSGEDFDKVVKEAETRGIAIANLTGYYLKADKLPANVASIVNKMKIGQTTPLISAGVNQYVLLKLMGTRYPKGNKIAMKQAMQAARALAEEGQRALFIDGVERKYITLRMKVFHWLDHIDYTAKGFDIHKLEKDNRVLAYVKGGRPITVAQLAKKIDGHFYHGVNKAKEAEVLRAKNILLTQMLQEKGLKRQAIAEGLQKSKDYRDRVADYDRTILFGVFMQAIVAPQVKVTPAELNAYYKKHIKDYSSGEQMRIRSLVFKKPQDARNAVFMLKSGNEFHWVKENAPGQEPKGGKGLVDFGDELVNVDTLPADAQKCLGGAKTGDARFYEGQGTKKGEKRFYVLYIGMEVPPAAKPFGEVKDEIQKKVYSENFKKDADKWFAKLRKAYDVKVYDAALKAVQPDEGKKQKN